MKNRFNYNLSILILGLIVINGCKSRSQQSSDLRSNRVYVSREQLMRELVDTTTKLSNYAYDRLWEDFQKHRTEFPAILGADAKIQDMELLNTKVVAAASPYFLSTNQSNTDIIVKLIFVTFRGTENNYQNLAADANYAGEKYYNGYAHAGFHRAYFFQVYEALAPRSPDVFLKKFVEEQFNDLQTESVPVSRFIVFSGHSFGAALSQISAMELCNPQSVLRLRYKFNCLAYSYGSPRVFDRTNADFFDSFMVFPEGLDIGGLNSKMLKSNKSHYNFQFIRDPVPKLLDYTPIGTPNFKHSGRIFRIREWMDDNDWDWNFDQHSMLRSYMKALDYWIKHGNGDFEVVELKN